MYDFFHRMILKRRFFMMDETPIQVLKEEGRRPQTKSYLWVLRTGEDGLSPIILYIYTPTRAGEDFILWRMDIKAITRSRKLNVVAVLPISGDIC